MAEIIMQPVWLYNGKVLEVHDDCFELSSHLSSCSSLTRFAGETETFKWSDIKKMDLIWNCFSGSIDLQLRHGKILMLKARKSSLMQVAAIMRRKMTPDMSPSGKFSLKRLVTADMAPLELKTGKPLLGRFDEKLPWDKLVSISVKPTCCGTRSKTAVSSSVELEAVNRCLCLMKISSCVSSGLLACIAKLRRKKVTPQDPVPGSDSSFWHPGRKFKSFSWSSFGEGDTGFKELARIRDSESHSWRSFETESHMVHLAQSGVILDRIGKCLACLPGVWQKVFLPWKSIASVSWLPGDCLGVTSSSMVITDVLGSKLTVPGTRKLDFITFCTHLGGYAPEQRRWNRFGFYMPLNVEVEGNGVFPDKHGVSIVSDYGFTGQSIMYVPWSKLEEMRLQTSKFRAAMDLHTSTGDSIRVAGTYHCFSSFSQMSQLWKQMYELRFGTFQTPLSLLYKFNRCRYFPASEVGNYSLKLVLENPRFSAFKRQVREFELEDVESCELASANGLQYLMVTVRSGSGERETVTLALNKNEDGRKIIDTIESRKKTASGPANIAKKKTLPPVFEQEEMPVETEDLPSVQQEHEPQELQVVIHENEVEPIETSQTVHENEEQVIEVLDVVPEEMKEPMHEVSEENHSAEKAEVMQEAHHEGEHEIASTDSCSNAIALDKVSETDVKSEC